MDRRVAIAGLLALGLIAGAFFGGRASVDTTVRPSADSRPATSTRHTIVKFFVPWQLDGSLSSDLKVVKRVSGTCWTGSIAVDEPYAWRCLAGNAIYDPCFAGDGYTHTRELVCDPQPWDSKVIILHLTKTLPRADANRSGSSSDSARSWAIELSNGDKCFLGTGANGIRGSVVMAYFCQSGNEAGPLDASRQPWTVDYERPNVDFLAPVSVSVAWNG